MEMEHALTLLPPTAGQAAGTTSEVHSFSRLDEARPRADTRSTVPADMSDESLMKEFAHGSDSAFEQLFDRHKGGVYRYGLRLTRSTEDAEDLTQEIWINVLRNKHLYQPKSRFTTWLYTIAHNRLIDFYRKNSRGVPVSYSDDRDLDEFTDPSMTEPSQQLETNRQVRDVFAAIDALPEAQREAFLLREEGDLSLDEIAAATEVSRETAKSRLRYAVAKLRRSVTVS